MSTSILDLLAKNKVKTIYTIQVKDKRFKNGWKDHSVYFSSLEAFESYENLKLPAKSARLIEVSTKIWIA